MNTMKTLASVPAVLASSLFLAACLGGNNGGDGDAGAICETVATRTYVVSSVVLPQEKSSYSADLNGDGKADNTYGNIVGALNANNINSQSVMDQFIDSGQSLMLIRHDSSDVAFTQDECSSSRFMVGQPASGGPDFSGAGVFKLDPAVDPTQFPGTIATGTFSGAIEAPSLDKAFTVTLPFAEAMIPIKLVGARVSYRILMDGLVSGQINGAITKQDLDNKVVPGMAQALNARVQADPSSSDSAQLLALFDTGGDGSCAVQGDKIISTCEIANNAIIKNVLNPDVQLFDSAGNYAPNAANTVRDSFSVGIAFKAVKATF